MMNNMKYTSKNLSLRLKKAGFEKESEMSYYGNAGIWDDALVENCMYKDVDDEFREHKLLPAYDYIWDLCIKYYGEIWGDKWFTVEKHTNSLIALIQEGKDQEEIEEYFLSNSILFK